MENFDEDDPVLHRLHERDRLPRQLLSCRLPCLQWNIRPDKVEIQCPGNYLCANGMPEEPICGHERYILHAPMQTFRMMRMNAPDREKSKIPMFPPSGPSNTQINPQVLSQLNEMGLRDLKVFTGDQLTFMKSGNSIR